MRIPRRFLLLCLAAATAVVTVFLFQSGTQADDVKFRYKWPCLPADICYLVQLDHTSGNTAWDIDPLGVAGLGAIPAVSEGTFGAYEPGPLGCNEASSLGLHVTITDIHGRTLEYAHLSAFAGGFQPGDRVLQGDVIGIEGDTGSTGCAPHLHLAGIASIDYIDGRAKSSLIDDPNTAYPSTNSVVGAYNAPGAAIRPKYFYLGSVYTSWAVVGWTADWMGTGLYTHYFPDPLEGHWGSKQDFRTHPDGLGLEYESIMTGRWAVNDAYRVEKPYYVSWLFGGEVPAFPPDPSVRKAIGPPLMGKISSFPGLCELAAGCVEYQKFHVGFVWKHQTLGYKAEFCPDIPTGTPAIRDYVVSISDTSKVVTKFGYIDAGLPFEPWYNAAWSILGEGTISVGDIKAVVSGFGAVCRVIA